MTLTGPEIPIIGRVPTPKAERTRFVLTISNASGRVPLSFESLTVIDEHGRLHAVKLSALTRHSNSTHTHEEGAIFLIPMFCRAPRRRWGPCAGPLTEGAP